jgi:hypothetical protein
MKKYILIASAGLLITAGVTATALITSAVRHLTLLATKGKSRYTAGLFLQELF